MSIINIDVGFARKDFSLKVKCDIPTSGVTALLGASGSGKSTLIRLIAGLEKASSGKICVGGEVWCDSQQRIQLPPQQRRVGVVFQHDGLFEHMTVWDNVAFGVQSPEIADVVEHWLLKTRMISHQYKLPRQLSGGERKRVALARALAHDPDVLLLDEPFSALDIDLRLHLRSELLELAQSLARPVVIATHDLEEASFLADYVAVMDQGTLVQFGPNKSVFTYPISVASARVLGWVNFLPLSELKHYAAAYQWFQSTFSDVDASMSVLALHPHSVEAAQKADAHLSGVVRRASTIGAFQQVEIYLKTGSKLHVVLPIAIDIQERATLYFRINGDFALPLSDAIL